MADKDKAPAVTDETAPGAPQGAGDNAAPPAAKTAQGAARGSAKAAAKPAECEYSVAELAGAARKQFDVPPEVVSAALRIAGKDRATLTEARRIVKQFKERQVK